MDNSDKSKESLNRWGLMGDIVGKIPTDNTPPNTPPVPFNEYGSDYLPEEVSVNSTDNPYLDDTVNKEDENDSPKQLSSEEISKLVDSVGELTPEDIESLHSNGDIKVFKNRLGFGLAGVFIILGTIMTILIIMRSS
jgi:hypothetical protein